MTELSGCTPRNLPAERWFITQLEEKVAKMAAESGIRDTGFIRKLLMDSMYRQLVESRPVGEEADDHKAKGR